MMVHLSWACRSKARLSSGPSFSRPQNTALRYPLLPIPSTLADPSYLLSQAIQPLPRRLINLILLLQRTHTISKRALHNPDIPHLAHTPPRKKLRLPHRRRPTRQHVRREPEPRAAPRSHEHLPAGLACAFARLVRDFLAPRGSELKQELCRRRARRTPGVELERRLELLEARGEGRAPRREVRLAEAAPLFEREPRAVRPSRCCEAGFEFGFGSEILEVREEYALELDAPCARDAAFADHA